MENYDSAQFEVKLTQYSGPLDALLDLAKSQKVNLENKKLPHFLFFSPRSSSKFEFLPKVRGASMTGFEEKKRCEMRAHLLFFISCFVISVVVVVDDF